MTIYITRSGKRYGPYSLAEAQEHVRSGNLAMTDLAWHEGLPNWIPLNQIQGFPFVRPATPVAPVATITPEELHRPLAQNKSLLQKLGTGIVAIGVLLFKFAAPILLLLKTGGTMLLSIVAYCLAFHWSWQMATGIVVLIFVHEMGHIIAAKWLGVPVTAPLFIPFIGASITMKQNPRDAWTEALMAYGGPLAGCIGSWICWALALQMQEPWMMLVAAISFVINLFNMIPVPPLDGGRICAAVSPWFWIIGLILLGASIFYFHAWNAIIIIILVLLAGIPRLKQTLFGRQTDEMRAYYTTHISNRLSMALMYLGLIAALLLGYWNASSYLRDLMDTSNS
jgi:Zn-dependent protease